jgi:hypothetical protein
VTAKKTTDDPLSRAKQAVRLAKAQLKKARKHYKAVKKAAKLSRSKKTKASKKTAAAAKPAAVRKSATVRKKTRRPAPDTMRSAAEVAKSVIERLQSPPPVLPPDPVIPKV